MEFILFFREYREPLGGCVAVFLFFREGEGIMAGIFQRIRLQGLARIHSLLDKDVDWNNVQIVKQVVRDLGAQVDELEEGVAEAGGYVRTVSRNKRELEDKAQKLDLEINNVLGNNTETDDHLAPLYQVELNGVNEQLGDVVSDLEEATTTAGQMNAALSGLKAKYTVAVQKQQRLAGRENARKAKEGAVKAIQMVSKMTEAGDVVDVDSVMNRMRQQQDVTDEKFDRAMTKLNSASGRDAELSKAASQIEERKRQLAQSKSA